MLTFLKKPKTLFMKVIFSIVYFYLYDRSECVWHSKTNRLLSEMGALLPLRRACQQGDGACPSGARITRGLPCQSKAPACAFPQTGFNVKSAFFRTRASRRSHCNFLSPIKRGGKRWQGVAFLFTHKPSLLVPVSSWLRHCTHTHTYTHLGLWGSKKRALRQLFASWSIAVIDGLAVNKRFLLFLKTVQMWTSQGQVHQSIPSLHLLGCLLPSPRPLRSHNTPCVYEATERWVTLVLHGDNHYLRLKEWLPPCNHSIIKF